MAKTAERISLKDTADNPVFQRHMIAYNEARTYIKGKVLEIGCGEGYGISLLAPLSDHYLALDKYVSGVFDEYQDAENIECMQMSVPPLEGIEENSFDTIVSFQVIEHIENDVEYLKEIKRVLKPGGQAILTTPNKAMSLTRNPWHIREYDISEMHSIIAKHFDNYALKGVFGNEKVMQYYEQNRQSVRRITRFDVFNLQYRLPRQLLKIPYDLLNRLNRKKLQTGDSILVTGITAEDYYLDEANDTCLDFFIIIKK